MDILDPCLQALDKSAARGQEPTGGSGRNRKSCEIYYGSLVETLYDEESFNNYVVV